MPTGFTIDPILTVVLAVMAAVLLWNVFLAGQIAQLRAAPPVFRGISGLVGLLLAPALCVHLLGGSIITGRAIASVQWLWPAVLVLFVLQAAYATARRLVTPFVGIPILVYDALVATAAIVRWSESTGWTVPTWAWAFPASESAVIGITTISAHR